MCIQRPAEQLERRLTEGRDTHTRRPRSAIHELDLEDEVRVPRDVRRRAPSAVAQGRGDEEPAALATEHALDALVPAFDHLALTKLELDHALVKPLASFRESALVPDLHSLARDSLDPTTSLQEFVAQSALQLVLGTYLLRGLRRRRGRSGGADFDGPGLRHRGLQCRAPGRRGGRRPGRGLGRRLLLRLLRRRGCRDGRCRGRPLLAASTGAAGADAWGRANSAIPQNARQKHFPPHARELHVFGHHAMDGAMPGMLGHPR
mmetsp:Transcript_23905/g.67009  ORF Transcript_23905/g.67009 Transcript_23905/m.67009 type:complete len:262 (-) Transcript_23905:136-921(-)